MNKLAFGLAGAILYVSSGITIFAGPSQTPVSPMKVTVDESGFHPASLSLHANTPAQITFVRTSDKTCATSVEIPDYSIKRELPLNKPVTVDLKPTKTGEVGFICGMKMFKGKLVVSDK
jgi:plastocyanin domain-containing protein